jgi:hypothetical protein
MIKENYEYSAAIVRLEPLLSTKAEGDLVLYNEIRSVGELAERQQTALRTKVRQWFTKRGKELKTLPNVGFEVTTSADRAETAPQKCAKSIERKARNGLSGVVTIDAEKLTPAQRKSRDHWIGRFGGFVVQAASSINDARSILGAPAPSRPRLPPVK